MSGIHPKVGVGMFVGALVSFTLAMLKLKYNIDLAGQESNLIVLVTAFASYMMPSDSPTQDVPPKQGV